MRGQRSIDRLLQLRILHQFKASSDAGPANASVAKPAADECVDFFECFIAPSF